MSSLFVFIEMLSGGSCIAGLVGEGREERANNQGPGYLAQVMSLLCEFILSSVVEHWDLLYDPWVISQLFKDGYAF